MLLHDIAVLAVLSACTSLCAEDRPLLVREEVILPCRAALMDSGRSIFLQRALFPNQYKLEYLETGVARTLPKHLEGTASRLA